MGILNGLFNYSHTSLRIGESKYRMRRSPDLVLSVRKGVYHMHGLVWSWDLSLHDHKIADTGISESVHCTQVVKLAWEVLDNPRAGFRPS